MSTIIYIIVGFLAFSGLYVFLIMQWRKRALGDYNADNQMHRAEEITQEVINGPLAAIKRQIGTGNVDAVTQCAHITTIGKQATGLAITAAKTVAWAAVGVKAKYRTADHACYLALSGDDLHYLFFEESELKEHLVLDQYRLANARLEGVSGADKVTRMSSITGMKSQKLSFDIEGKKMEILFFGAITRAPEGVFGGFGKQAMKNMEDFKVAGRYFKEKLARRYPHLVAA